MSCQFLPGSKIFENKYSFDGKEWCFFHLPMKDLNGNESQKNTIKLEKINVFYEILYKWIEGKLRRGEKYIDFSYMVFPIGLDEIFYSISQEISGDLVIKLNNCQIFGDSAIYTVEKLNLSIDMIGAEFFSYVWFNRAIFTSSRFEKTIFHNTVTFSSCKFSNCTFSDAKFFQHSSFYSSLLNKSDFYNCEFYDDVDFLNSSLEYDNSFHNVIFHGNTCFATMSEANSDKEFGEIDFRSSEFGHVEFTNRKFLDKTDFTDCTFKKAPLFHGCTFHQFTIFPERERFKDTSSDYAVSAYRTLALAMSNIKARNEEGMFYSLYQESLKNSKKIKSVDLFVSTCYKIFSNYGQSIARPIGFLFLTFLTSWIIYCIRLSPIVSLNKKIDWGIAAKSLHIAFLQIVKPFSIMSVLKQYSLQSDGIVTLVSNIQSLLSLIFIALLVLAIRWKFKRD